MKCSKCCKEKSLLEFGEKNDGTLFKVCIPCRDKRKTSYVKKAPKVSKDIELCGNNVETFRCSGCDVFYSDGMGGFKTCEKCRDKNKKVKNKKKPVSKITKLKKLETIKEEKEENSEADSIAEFRFVRKFNFFGLPEFWKNKYGLVFDVKTFIIYGKFLYEDTTIHQLSKDDIELCKKFKAKYSVNDSRAVPLKTEEEKLAEEKAKRAEEKAEKKKEQDERKMAKKIAQQTIKDIDNRDKKNVDKLLKDMGKSSPIVKNLIKEAIKEKEVEDKEYEEENHYSESESDSDVEISD